MLRHVMWSISKTAAVRKNCFFRLPRRKALDSSEILTLIHWTELYQVSEDSNLQELFKFAVSRDPHFSFRCTALSLMFLLALFKECAGNIFFQPADKRHV